jgi:hypothetical protein
MPTIQSRFIDKRHAESTRLQLGEYATSLYKQGEIAASALQLAEDFGLPTEALREERDRLGALWQSVADVNNHLSDLIKKWES